MAWITMENVSDRSRTVDNGQNPTPRYYVKKYGMDLATATKISEDMMSQELWENDLYLAQVRRKTGVGFFDRTEQNANNFAASMGEIAHCSIKRIDGSIARDWRHFQQIKNDIFGNECEAFEMYPAESRLTDTANQYHLYVFTNGTVRLPVGFEGRAVSDERISSSHHQRKRE
jgi:hypothetical protein